MGPGKLTVQEIFIRPEEVEKYYEVGRISAEQLVALESGMSTETYSGGNKATELQRIMVVTQKLPRLP